MQQAIIKEHSIIKLKIADLVFDPSNPNVMSEGQMKGLRKSMQKYGYLTPVVVDLNNKIADGEHRALIYKELGLTEIPAIRMKLESDADRRELRQVLNKLHGFHDKSKDADELVQIFQAQKLDELAELIAQPKEDLQRLMLRYHPGLDFITEENQEELDKLIDDELKRIAPDTALGDIYQLGNHMIMCADCTDKRSVDRLLEDHKVDMLLTDPPYGVEYTTKNEMLNLRDNGKRLTIPIQNDSIDDYREFFNAFLSVIPLSQTNTIYTFMAGMHLHDLRLALDDQKIKWGDYLIWVKNNHVLGRKDYNARHEFVVYGWKGKHSFYGHSGSDTILDFNKAQNNPLHPTTKPTPLLKKLIRDGSQSGMNVYDPFLGSGSTLIACEQLDRKCYGMEIDPHYVDICVKRWEHYTGKKAIKL